ncbi:hypothetical protein C0992_009795 [Termitomyces sp. T32_za158]|nr:hypothetical protein C0992_009795 [Termitomyces sp. T32_za158]
MFTNFWFLIRLGIAGVGVINTVASVIPLIALYQVAEGNAAVTSGILRAKGQQAIGAALNIRSANSLFPLPNTIIIVFSSAYYLIGLPLGVWLAFYWKMDLKGLWVGMVVALTYCSVIGSFLCYRTDWVREAAQVAERIEEDGHTENYL